MKFSYVLAFGGLCGGVAAQTDKVKIMFLGDSITEATCWRAMIWDMLAAENLTDKVELVGSMTNNYMNCTTTAPGFNLHHEGHIGWQAVNISKEYLPGWLATSKPDIVQFMLGTNDVNGGNRTLDDVLNAYTLMVDEMRSSNPDMHIIMDKIIPLPFNNVPIKAINAAIPAWLDTHNTTTSPIYLADCSEQAGYEYTWLRDTIHPDADGDRFMAKQIGPIVIQLVKSKLEQLNKDKVSQGTITQGVLKPYERY
ncbi:cellulose-binding protein [Thozetella sp. PMI_491]|nr:cellulose-binding protein [Thozetella sp. PMI_491]